MHTLTYAHIHEVHDIHLEPNVTENLLQFASLYREKRCTKIPIREDDSFVSLLPSSGNILRILCNDFLCCISHFQNIFLTRKKIVEIFLLIRFLSYQNFFYL